MLETSKRPRNLSWTHAGALLFGDWGTSRLYVLGLAFFFTGHASPLFLGAMSLLMTGVAWAYTHICDHFQDGGGVYTSARRISPLLSVIGATLLMCDYIVTASLSIFEGMHYFGAPEPLVIPLSIVAILVLGVVNWFGAKSAGRLALTIALAALGASLVVAVLCVPYFMKGLGEITAGHQTVASPWERWHSLVRIVLALSGVEAIANMTGLMKQPVRTTSRRALWVVLAEVVALNLIFGIALSGLPGLAEVKQPDYFTYSAPAALEAAKAQGLPAPEPPDAVKEYRDTAVKVLATESGKHWFGETTGSAIGRIAGILFGLLLISAGNTVIVDMIAVQYAMGRDGELPKAATRLNYSGVPWLPLVLACAAPVLVLLVAQDLTILAELYAVGVVGAITINVLCSAWNRELTLTRAQRAGMWGVGLVMLAIEVTIVSTKMSATVFAGSVVGAVLATRFVARRQKRIAAGGEPMPEPATGWLAELRREPPAIDLSRPRIMLAARGRNQADFAVDLARRRHATLFAIFVRQIRVLDVAGSSAPKIDDDKQALESLGAVAVIAREQGVPFIPVYVSSPDIADEILDFTVTYGCDTLILGKSARRRVTRALEGDVVAKVAQHLPDGVALITREPTPHPLAPRPAPAPPGPEADTAPDNTLSPT